MPGQEHAVPAAIAGEPGRGRVPYWRALLESRWHARLREITELSLAYHGAAADGPGLHGDGGPGDGGRGDGGRGDGGRQQEIQQLLHRTVAARRKLADLEEALDRLTDGRFGYCEQCGSAIPAVLLARVPERRYCQHCAAAAPALALVGGPAAPDGGQGSGRRSQG